MGQRYCRRHLQTRPTLTAPWVRKPRLPSRFSLVLILLTAVSVPSLSAQSWYDSAWTSRQKITISRNAAAYSLTASPTNSPFLIKVGAGNDLFSKAQSNGNDIVFTADDGVTRIPHGIENHNAGTPDFTAGMKVPVFHYDVATVIYMYYGNPNVSSQEQVSEVWKKAYTGVNHLGEDGASAWGTLKLKGTETIAGSIGSPAPRTIICCGNGAWTTTGLKASNSRTNLSFVSAGGVVVYQLTAALAVTRTLSISADDALKRAADLHSRRQRVAPDAPR